MLGNIQVPQPQLIHDQENKRRRARKWTLLLSCLFCLIILALGLYIVFQNSKSVAAPIAPVQNIQTLRVPLSSSSSSRTNPKIDLQVATLQDNQNQLVQSLHGYDTWQLVTYQDKCYTSSLGQMPSRQAWQSKLVTELKSTEEIYSSLDIPVVQDQAVVAYVAAYDVLLSEQKDFNLAARKFKDQEDQLYQNWQETKQRAELLCQAAVKDLPPRCNSLINKMTSFQANLKNTGNPELEETVVKIQDFCYGIDLIIQNNDLVQLNQRLKSFEATYQNLMVTYPTLKSGAQELDQMDASIQAKYVDLIILETAAKLSF